MSPRTTVTTTASITSGPATKDQILLAVSEGELSPDQAAKLLEAMKPTGPNGSLYFKVSPKGALSVYGLQGMPITLYLDQWECILGRPGECRTPFAKALWAFVQEWDGREYQGETSEYRDGKATGKKLGYTATLKRKHGESAAPPPADFPAERDLQVHAVVALGERVSSLLRHHQVSVLEAIGVACHVLVGCMNSVHAADGDGGQEVLDCVADILLHHQEPFLEHRPEDGHDFRR